MPAPRPEHRDNPLRRLRLILGNGPKPMHQEEFCRLTGVALAVLRALERGSRGQISFENCLDRIGQATGATFSTRDGQWHPAGAKRLYQYSDYLAFIQTQTDKFKKYCLHALILRVLGLFKAVSPHRWLGLFLHLMKVLEETAEKYEIKGWKKILENTEPQWATSQRMISDGVRVDEPPRIVRGFRCFPGVEISDPDLEDDETLLDLRTSFASAESGIDKPAVSSREARAQFDKLKAAGVLTFGDGSTEPDNI